MLMNTHFQIARSVLENMDYRNSELIKEKNFIYGNIKPDALSKYKLHRHYMDESFEMIASKIEYLSNLDLDCLLSKRFSLSRFSQELGVVCHFLCDFFCVAHSERWEFKHSMNRHVVYEKDLAAAAKATDLTIIKGDSMEKQEFIDFFNVLYEQYKSNGNYIKNDLQFSTYICNSVTDYVLRNIIANSEKTLKIIA